MAVTSGFFNSISGDRKYSADQMGSLFDGIINDGIYQAIGNAFAVSAGSGMQVKVGTGRGWFKNTWILNDAVMAIDITAADLLLPRIDTVAIKVDKSDGVRANTIVVLSGGKATNPLPPTFTNTAAVFYYPLADISIPAAATAISASQISNRRGTSATPWVTGPLTVLDASDIYLKWTTQWNEWFADNSAREKTSFDSFMSTSKNSYDAWFAQLQNLLTTNQASYLAAEIIKLNNKLSGFIDDPILYEMLLDGTGKPILDSNSTAIDGRVVYVKA